MLAAIGLACAACARSDAEPQAERTADAGMALPQAVDEARARADSVIDALRPVPLMTGAQESGLRRYDNDAHLARARALGVRPGDETELRAALDAGRLVAVPDSSARFVLRAAESSRALLVPAALALLQETGRRFHAALGERGLPPLRLVVTSMLRSAADQAELRRSNPNAAAGTSTHEFGTTLDIAYEEFAAPAGSDPLHALALERAAAIKSRELTAILGGVLRDMQAEGLVLVTLERQQPVFHITVARANLGA